MGCRSIRSSVYRRDISNSLSLEISKFIYSSWREQLSRSPRLYNKRRRWKKIVKIVLNARISAFLFLDKEKDTYIFHVCKIYKKKKKKERKTRNHRFSPRFSPRFYDFVLYRISVMKFKLDIFFHENLRMEFYGTWYNTFTVYLIDISFRIGLIIISW